MADTSVPGFAEILRESSICADALHLPQRGRIMMDGIDRQQPRLDACPPLHVDLRPYPALEMAAMGAVLGAGTVIFLAVKHDVGALAWIGTLLALAMAVVVALVVVSYISARREGARLYLAAGYTHGNLREFRRLQQAVTLWSPGWHQLHDRLLCVRRVRRRARSMLVRFDDVELGTGNKCLTLVLVGEDSYARYFVPYSRSGRSVQEVMMDFDPSMYQPAVVPLALHIALCRMLGVRG